MAAAHGPDALSGDETIILPEFDSPPLDPVNLLVTWIAGAEARQVREPRAVTLATAHGGRVSSRVVLVKEIDTAGIVFTTHVGSRKGIELDANPSASVNFYWRETLQQVSVSGSVSKTAADESDRLFDERTRAARAAVVISDQSAVLHDEQRLIDDATRLADGSGAIDRPIGWGGYRLVPDEIEFWQGRSSRLHRRLRYRYSERQWRATRLQP